MSSNWRFCGAFQGGSAELQGCWNLAREKAFKKSKEFKAGASELMMLVPTFAFFFSWSQWRAPWASCINRL